MLPKSSRTEAHTRDVRDVSDWVGGVADEGNIARARLCPTVRVSACPGRFRRHQARIVAEQARTVPDRRGCAARQWQLRGRAGDNPYRGACFATRSRSSILPPGEQIDGSFRLEGETYLLEARWRQALSDASQLRAFQGKVEDRPAWARGLFVSYSGFSEEGLLAFSARRIILMDGLDIHDALQRNISISDVLSEKVRRSVEFKKAFVRVRDIFPE